MSWSVFDDGKSIGTRGSEGGVITHDEEHTGGARITIEREGGIAPFSITCGVYGWMCHTRFFGEGALAQDEFVRMKAGLEHILNLISACPGEEKTSDAIDKAVDAISAFVEQFP
ncbi:MAG: hypothetical protein ACO1TE_03215 [Prosthecobacter sp.]